MRKIAITKRTLEKLKSVTILKLMELDSVEIINNLVDVLVLHYETSYLSCLVSVNYDENRPEENKTRFDIIFDLDKVSCSMADIEDEYIIGNLTEKELIEHLRVIDAKNIHR